MAVESGGGGGGGITGEEETRREGGVRPVEEEYAAARKSRPIFQRGDDRATERPSDHLKYLVAGRKLSGTGSR